MNSQGNQLPLNPTKSDLIDEMLLEEAEAQPEDKWLQEEAAKVQQARTLKAQQTTWVENMRAKANSNTSSGR